MELNLSSGVYTERARVSAPLKLRLPAGINPNTYADCLNFRGRNPAREMIQAIDRTADCRRQAARITLFRTDSNPRAMQINGELDARKFDDCVGTHIDVEVLPAELHR